MANDDFERAIELLNKVALCSWRTNEQRYVRLDYSVQQEVDEFLRHLTPHAPDATIAEREANLTCPHCGKLIEVVSRFSLRR